LKVSKQTLIKSCPGNGVHYKTTFGWHVPTDEEWTTLIDCLGGEDIAGGKLKETGTTHWSSPNTSACNCSGFTALPGGYRDYLGGFSFIANSGYWWRITEGGTFRYLDYNSSYAGIGNNDSHFAYSVRCVQDNNTSITNSVISDETTLYPNPATEKLYLKNNNYTNSRIMIFDIQGKQVLSKQRDSDPIDISGLEKGVYVVKIVCSGNVMITKFIKE